MMTKKISDKLNSTSIRFWNKMAEFYEENPFAYYLAWFMAGFLYTKAAILLGQKLLKIFAKKQ